MGFYKTSVTARPPRKFLIKEAPIHPEGKPMSIRKSLAALRCAVFLLLISLMFAEPASKTATANGGPTRLLRTPTESATQIAFAYANNIWVVERAGGLARRLTSFQGQTSNPHFSPDGKWIAFSGEYAGNIDVYV